MYKTVDASMLWMKEFTKHLKIIDMTHNECDMCVFYLHYKCKLVLALVVYVENTLLTGTTEAIQWCHKEFCKKYRITRFGQICKYLKIWYNWKINNKGETYVEMSMPRLVDKTVQKYNKFSKPRLWN